MYYDLAKLEQGVKSFGMDISKDQLLKFDKYISLLLEWNARINLTSIVEPEEIMVEHFLDSISILKEMNIKKDSYSLIDVGSGAGFPGIPLKIMEPNIDLVLLDSLRKRTEYLKILKEELNLKNVSIIHARAEDLAYESEYRENFDIVVSRAVAPLNILSEYCIPFTRRGGIFVSYKGPAAQEELFNAKNAIQVLGGGAPRINNVRVPFSPRIHNLIFIQKETPTAKKYPRSPAKIKKSPL